MDDRLFIRSAVSQVTVGGVYADMSTTGPISLFILQVTISIFLLKVLISILVNSMDDFIRMATIISIFSYNVVAEN